MTPPPRRVPFPSPLRRPPLIVAPVASPLVKAAPSPAAPAIAQLQPVEQEMAGIDVSLATLPAAPAAAAAIETARVDDALTVNTVPAGPVDAPLEPATRTNKKERVFPAAPEREVGLFPTPPIYFGMVRLLDWNLTARGGMSVNICILDTPPTGLHPFKGLFCGKQSGQRLKLWFGHLNTDEEAPDLDSIENIHAGEGLLMRWSDDNVNGMNVRFLLDDGPDGTNGQHPFHGAKIGRSEGDKFRLAAWAVSEDERLLDPRQTKKEKEPFYKLTEVRQSVMLCKNNRFISYIHKHRERLLKGKDVGVDVSDKPIEFATKALYIILDIPSREVLGYDNADGRRAVKAFTALKTEYFDDFYNRRSY